MSDARFSLRRQFIHQSSIFHVDIENSHLIGLSRHCIFNELLEKRYFSVYRLLSVVLIPFIAHESASTNDSNGWFW